MAKFKEKIKELMTKYSISEDAAKEFLEVYDGDMGEINGALREAAGNVQKWNDWYNGIAPGLTAQEEENKALKAQVEAMKKAMGVVDTNQNTNTGQSTNQSANTNFDPDKFEQRIYGNFSAVQKDIYNVQRYHMKNFGELPDLEPIEKLINEKNLSPWAAYQEWVGPMDQDRKEKELRAKIEKELMEKFQADATRRGTNTFMRPVSDAVSPLDEDADAAPVVKEPPKPGERTNPSELELMADFVGTMRQGRGATVNH